MTQLWYKTNQSTNKSVKHRNKSGQNKSANVLVTSPVVFGDFPIDQKIRKGYDFLMEIYGKKFLEIRLHLFPELCSSKQRKREQDTYKFLPNPSNSSSEMRISICN